MPIPPVEQLSVDAAVFDKDGTLIDVHATWGPATAAILRDLAPTDAALHAAALALQVDVEGEQLGPTSPVLEETNADLATRIGPALDRVSDPTLIADLDRLARRHTAASVVGLPGVPETLVTLRERGIWIGIATNDAEGCARDQMAALGWTDLFDNILGYDSGHGGKPGTGMLMASLAAAAATAERSAMVGDTATDMAAGAAAGMSTILLESPRGVGLVATARIQSFSDLAGLIVR